MNSASDSSLLLLFDGTCGLCTRLVSWVRAHDKAGQILALPNQTPHLAEQLGLTRTQVDREVWAIDSAGRKLAGAAAIHRVLDELGGIWALPGVMYRLVVWRWLEDRTYRWVADHRHWLARWGVTPECDQPGVRC